ncbi:peptidoglycan-binding protein [Myxococcota bacterium]|nr:peptidoglycan-binding protein [Myxococcota bacterium]
MMRIGSEGESVRQLQEMLRQRGHAIEADGKFGTDTDRAVRAFQNSQRIGVDGVVGPETMGRLQRSVETPNTPVRREGVASAPRIDEPQPRNGSTLRAGELARNDEARRNATGRTTLAPANATPEQRYDHYAAIVRANGGTVDPNGTTILGLRGLSRTHGGPRDAGSTRAYDDTFVVLRGGRAYEFAGATHPGQLRSTLSPDVDRNGLGDVGMINPGTYRARPNGNYNGNASWHVTRTDGNGRIPGVRDTNGDGRFSDAERTASARRGDTLTEILFHPGYSDRPRSIGCLTLSPNVYDDFISRVGGRGQGFSFTLVDANR